MRLFEFTEADPIVTRLVAITDQLKSDLENKEVDPTMTTDQLLQYLANYDIVVDTSDLYNMIQKPPLKNVISNIQGQNVIFKGYEGDGAEPNPPQDQSQKVVSQMANKAASKIK